MIEIIKEQVELPSLSAERRFQKICENNKWEVIVMTHLLQLFHLVFNIVATPQTQIGCGFQGSVTTVTSSSL